VGLRVGIAGYGLAGAVFHAPLIEAVDGLDVAAVMTRSAERADQARRAHRDVRIVESVDELLEAIDVMVVATPNSSHVELALAGIDAGKHVVIDKPMAVTAADAQRVVDADADRVTVFHNRRWDGDFLTVQRLVREGALGRVLRFESRFERFRPEVRQVWREHGSPEEGGGVLLDLGPHLIDQAIQLFGPPEAVYAEVRTRREEAEVDDDAFVALTHSGGEISHLWMSAITALHGPRFRVNGLAAGLGVDGLDPQEDQLRGGMHPGESGYGEGRAGWMAPADAAGDPVPIERGRYEDFYAGVARWARGEAAAPVDPRDGVRVLEVIEKCR
jgi:predicted dehydrogenase